MLAPDAFRRQPRVLVIQNEWRAPPALLSEAARVAGLDLDVRLVEAGTTLPDRVEEDGLVVLGGDAHVYEAPTHRYLYQEMNLIRQAGSDRKPVLGICLGGQLAAEALGGKVRRGERGLEIGWTNLHVTGEGGLDPVTGAYVVGRPLFEWHTDTFEPPPGSVPLLTGRFYHAQAFRMGSVWGLQAHPEVDEATIASWCDAYGERDLMAAGIQTKDLLEGANEKSAFGKRLLESWCRIVAQQASIR